jgi:hypothetical protein
MIADTLNFVPFYEGTWYQYAQKTAVWPWSVFQGGGHFSPVSRIMVHETVKVLTSLRKLTVDTGVLKRSRLRQYKWQEQHS